LEDIVTADRATLEIIEGLRASLDSPSPVMIHGEPGTGKKMLARALHNASSRREAPFLAVDCASLPESLLDGMLFGTEEGAFTGAKERPGLFERACGGTLLLDGIDSLPSGLQGKLLRVVEDLRYRRVGGLDEREVSLKIISTTGAMPREAVALGNFRPELMLKLGTVLVSLPPLRDRQGDVPLLVGRFIEELRGRMQKDIETVSPEANDTLLAHLWPGNVQELRYTLESAMNQAPQGETVLQLDHFNSSLLSDVLKGRSVPASDLGPGKAPRYEPVRTGIFLHRAAEVERIAAALEAAGGNAAKAARSLKISPQLMNYKLKKFCLKKKITVHVERVLGTMEDEGAKRPKRDDPGSPASPPL
jgi:arginine utilization regulatory protein